MAPSTHLLLIVSATSFAPIIFARPVPVDPVSIGCGVGCGIGVPALMAIPPAINYRNNARALEEGTPIRPMFYGSNGGMLAFGPSGTNEALRDQTRGIIRQQPQRQQTMTYPPSYNAAAQSATTDRLPEQHGDTRTIPASQSMSPQMAQSMTFMGAVPNRTPRYTAPQVNRSTPQLQGTADQRRTSVADSQEMTDMSHQDLSTTGPSPISVPHRAAIAEHPTGHTSVLSPSYASVAIGPAHTSSPAEVQRHSQEIQRHSDEMRREASTIPPRSVAGHGPEAFPALPEPAAIAPERRPMVAPYPTRATSSTAPQPPRTLEQQLWEAPKPPTSLPQSSTHATSSTAPAQPMRSTSQSSQSSSVKAPKVKLAAHAV